MHFGDVDVFGPEPGFLENLLGAAHGDFGDVMSRKPAMNLPLVRCEARTEIGSLRNCRATLSDARTIAAAPSPVGQHCSSVNGSAIMREASTSSTVTSLRICASGLSAPFLRFFTETPAICSALTP